MNCGVEKTVNRVRLTDGVVCICCSVPVTFLLGLSSVSWYIVQEHLANLVQRVARSSDHKAAGYVVPLRIYQLDFEFVPLLVCRSSLLRGMIRVLCRVKEI